MRWLSVLVLLLLLPVARADARPEQVTIYRCTDASGAGFDPTSADILVVNHHLLFSDIAVRRAQQNYTAAAVLPPYRRLVLDEAHNLEDACVRAPEQCAAALERSGAACVLLQRVGVSRFNRPRVLICVPSAIPAVARRAVIEAAEQAGATSANLMEEYALELTTQTIMALLGLGYEYDPMMRQLRDDVCRFANGLKSLGVKKGDRVTIYMPMVPEAVIAILACARLGAPHSVIFGGFSSQAIVDRILATGQPGVRPALTALLPMAPYADIEAIRADAGAKHMKTPSSPVVRPDSSHALPYPDWADTGPAHRP